MNCSDCHAKEGELHEPFCTKEICPFCGGQLASCDCIYTVLNFNEEEARVFSEYIDDSIEPLKDIVKRWALSLEQKGRVPFSSQGNLHPKMVSYEVVQNLESHIHYRDEQIKKLKELIKGAARMVEQTLKLNPSDSNAPREYVKCLSRLHEKLSKTK